MRIPHSSSPDSSSSPRRPRLLVVLVLALVAGLLPVATAGPAGALWPGGVVDLRGHGWGHGRGLGQYGALGYAVDHQWTHPQILDHYYGGTTAGAQADGDITVRLAELDNAPLVVTTDQAVFTVGSNTFQPGQAARIRRNALEWVIEAGPSCTGPWTVVQDHVDLNQEPTAAVVDDPGDDIGRMISACGSNRRHYRGTLKAIWFDLGTRAVNTVRMESYLRGVVPREMPMSWADLGGGRGLEALKAQAVAARSYAWAEGRDARFKTCDTISCQVYGGAGLNGVRIEDARTDRAVAETAGLVRLRNGVVQRTEFSSSTGGHTAGGTFPAVPDAGDATASNPNHDWSVRLPVTQVEAAYPSIGRLEHIAVIERNGIGKDGGRVKRLTMRGQSGSVTVTGDAFRSAVGIKSDWFRIIALTKPAVSLTPTGSGDGYWLTSNDGGVFSYGDAVFHGSAGNLALNGPVLGMAARPNGAGYWLVGSDGGIFSYGDAPFYGSTGNIKLNQPVVGMAPTPSGHGYWMVASDGGIFAYGDASFHGSTGGTRLNKPIVGMAPTATGNGYWLVATDGGIFAFGDAVFHGSAGAIALNRPIVGMAARPDGAGYWLVADDGGVFTYGAATFRGAATGVGQAIVAIAATPSGDGYWVLAVDGGVYVYGDAQL
ncbi:MAG: SpoIID/LytB domain-containing protein [Acidimicrobiia bacterium]